MSNLERFIIFYLWAFYAIGCRGVTGKDPLRREPKSGYRKHTGAICWHIKTQTHR